MFNQMKQKLSGVSTGSQKRVTGDDDHPEYNQLSAADKELEKEIDSGVDEIKKCLVDKKTRLNEYAQHRANERMGTFSTEELRFLRKDLIRNFKEIDSAIDSKREEVWMKYNLFSNKQFAEERLKFPIEDALEPLRTIMTEMMKLELIRDGGGYVNI